jgi:hypothetical protein
MNEITLLPPCMISEFSTFVKSKAFKDTETGKWRSGHFITSNWEITAAEVALIYRYRWTIALVFKKLKQNFQLHFFYSDTENGIKTQVWCTLIAHLLLHVIRRLSQTKKAFLTVAALIRIHLISHLDLSWIVTEGRRAYAKRTASKNKSSATIQLAFFRGG